MRDIFVDYHAFIISKESHNIDCHPLEIVIRDNNYTLEELETEIGLAMSWGAKPLDILKKEFHKKLLKLWVA